MPSPLLNTIKRALNSGVSSVYVSTGATYLDPATRTTKRMDTEYNIKAVVNSDSMNRLGFTYGDGLVQSGDFEMLVAGGQGFDPKEGDRVSYGSSYVEVVKVKPTYYKDEVVVWNLLVRDGYTTRAV